MLSKEYKLPIQIVLRKNSKSCKSPFFTLKIFSTSNPLPRFGIVVSSKTLPKATDRNRLKRIFFDFAQTLIQEKRVKVNDYLIITYPSISNLSKEILIEEFEQVFSFFAPLTPLP